MKSPFRSIVLALALGHFAASCSLLGPEPDPTRYAVLVSVDELSGPAPEAAKSSTALRVGLGPILVPDYLRRTAIVTREEGTRLVPSATESWAEPFERSLERVLAIDLRHQAPVGSLILHPWYETDRPKVQVEIAFARCERDQLLGVVVVARWKIRWLDSSREPVERETRIERACPSPDGAVVAREISAALAELCDRIGKEL